jgi:predicted amidophosphoribosyltransferase
MNQETIDFLFPKREYDNINMNNLLMSAIANTVIKCNKISSLNHYYLFPYNNLLIKNIFSKIKLAYEFTYIVDLYKVFNDCLLTKLYTNVDNYLFIIIPSDPLRYIERGFGINEEIMKLMNNDGYHCISPFIKIKNTQNKSQLNKVERSKITDVYKLYNDELLTIVDKYEKIIILDDILTTGTTVLSVYNIVRTLHINIEFLTISGQNLV